MAVPKKKISRKKRDFKRYNKKIILPYIIQQEKTNYLKHHFNKKSFKSYQGMKNLILLYKI